MREAVRDYSRGAALLLGQVQISQGYREGRDGEKWMSAENAINSNDASNAEESAPSIEVSTKSKKKLRLLCNPQKLPKPKAPKARLPKKEELSAEEAVRLNDYFFDQKAKSMKRARERKWI